MKTSDLMKGVLDVMPGAPMADFLALVNRMVRKIAQNHRWNYLRADTDIELIEGYDTGTVAVTEGSDTITGTDTVWTSAMTGRKISIAGDLAFYTFTFVSTTSGTLDRNYAKADDTSTTYKIYQDTYSMPADFAKLESLVNLENGQQTLPIALNSYIDVRNSTLLTPIFVGGRFKWSFFGKDSSGNEQIIVHRFPGPDEFIKIYYLRQPVDVTDPITEPDLAEFTHDWLLLELQLSYAMRARKDDKDPLLIQWLQSELKEAKKIALLAESNKRRTHLYNQPGL